MSFTTVLPFRYPKGKVGEKHLVFATLPLNKAYVLIEDEKTSIALFSTFPFGDGGPLAVDEVKSYGSYICISFVFFYAKKSTLH